MRKLMKMKNKIDAQVEAHRNSDKIHYWLAQKNGIRWALTNGVAFAIEVCKCDAERLFLYSNSDRMRKRGLEDLAKKLETLNA